MVSAYTKGLIKSFVAQHGADIVRAINNTGLFFPAVVAQLSVESENGDSDLSQRANNYGGIKGNASNGILLDTTESNSRTPTRAYFKKYANFPAFIQDYVSILQSDRYVSAGVLEATTPEDQITKLVQAGYSTMTPKAYLASGIQDRISATRDLFGLGKISDDNIGSIDAMANNSLNTAVFGMDISNL
jgi:flagellum-specific peptidoglycan hydrolase FlgJ